MVNRFHFSSEHILSNLLFQHERNISNSQLNETNTTYSSAKKVLTFWKENSKKFCVFFFLIANAKLPTMKLPNVRGFLFREMFNNPTVLNNLLSTSETCMSIRCFYQHIPPNGKWADYLFLCFHLFLRTDIMLLF